MRLPFRIVLPVSLGCVALAPMLWTRWSVQIVWVTLGKQTWVTACRRRSADSVDRAIGGVAPCGKSTRMRWFSRLAAYISPSGSAPNPSESANLAESAVPPLPAKVPVLPTAIVVSMPLTATMTDPAVRMMRVRQSRPGQGPGGRGSLEAPAHDRQNRVQLIRFTQC
jgi:hypothetical protein